MNKTGGEKIASEEGSLEDYASAAGGQFLNAGDVEKGKTLQKQVRETDWRTFDDGATKPLLVFEDETALVLNKTNAQFLVDAGFELETLPGAVITLGQQPGMYKGKPTPTLRIVGAEAK